ncbi:MAG: hypothetical protein K2K42_01100, partial [Eubacterium sp.]|nr:hypothetical protein [Eubacterium sp.]
LNIALRRENILPHKFHLQNKNAYAIMQIKEINVRHCCAPKKAKTTSGNSWFSIVLMSEYLKARCDVTLY